MAEKIDVNGKPYDVIKLLGKGKGGYSYLVTDGQNRFVLKQIHHEPCEYYTFGDKLQSELRDYGRLSKLGLPMPKLIEYDESNERLLKEYIEGDVISDIIERGQLTAEHIKQITDMCDKLYPAGLNIDYYPTNFVLMNGKIYYIDYECNEYSDQWNFENWGKQYYKLK